MTDVVPWDKVPPAHRRAHHPSASPEATFPGQCTAAVRHFAFIRNPGGYIGYGDGYQRCRNSAIAGELYCWSHGGEKKKDRLQATRLAKARQLLEDAGYKVEAP